MKAKKELHLENVSRISGRTSRELTDRCPDLRTVFPSAPCTNFGCEFRIREPGYMDCAFVASEAGDHTLEAIGEMMGITREGARLIERRALLKLRHNKQIQDGNSSVHQSGVASGVHLDASVYESLDAADEVDELSTVCGRKLA